MWLLSHSFSFSEYGINPCLFGSELPTPVVGKLFIRVFLFFLSIKFLSFNKKKIKKNRFIFSTTSCFISIIFFITQFSTLKTHHEYNNRFSAIDIYNPFVSGTSSLLWYCTTNTSICFTTKRNELLFLLKYFKETQILILHLLLTF